MTVKTQSYLTIQLGEKPSVFLILEDISDLCPPHWCLIPVFIGLLYSTIIGKFRQEHRLIN